MKDLILTREIPHQAGWYWMVEDGFEDYPESHCMVQVMDMGDHLWVCGGFKNACLKNFSNFWWAGPMPLPEKKDGV